jgi:aminoglycoside 6'-N-acetyltransferase I
MGYAACDDHAQDALRKGLMTDDEKRIPFYEGTRERRALLIKEYRPEDLKACVKLLIEAYNCNPWNNHWTEPTGKRYLNEIAASRDFVGFVECLEDELIGALFAHKKTWWTNDELFVDELFVQPRMQGRGFGKALLSHAENHARSLGLGGLTLLTNRYLPAKAFYVKEGYTQADHVVFMYKEFR